MAPLRKLKEVLGLVHVFLLAMHPPCCQSPPPYLSHERASLTCDRRHDFGQISSCGVNVRAPAAAREGRLGRVTGAPSDGVLVSWRVRVTGWSRGVIHPPFSGWRAHSAGAGAHAGTAKRWPRRDQRGELASKSGLRFSTNDATPSFTSLPQNPRNSSAKDASKIGPA